LSILVDRNMLLEPAELALAEKTNELTQQLAKLTAVGDYRGAMSLIAELREPVNAFFENVMVMVPDIALRDNRLKLLVRVLQSFSGIADFSEIVTAG